MSCGKSATGNRQQARTAVHTAMKLATNRDVENMAAFVLARAGDTAGAERLAAELDKTFPLDTLVQRPFGADSDLRRRGLKLAERGGKNGKKRAIIATARKLAVLLHRLWVSGEVYEPLRNSHPAAMPAAA